MAEAQISHGATPTVASAESGIGFGLADGVDAGGTPITAPTETGTNYSWIKWLHLHVTANGGNSALSDREVAMDEAATTGFYLFFKAESAYDQADSGNKPTDSTASNGAVPAGYTAMTTSFQTWDADSEAATNDDENGDYLVVVAGIGADYAGSAAADAALPDILMRYLETAA